MVGVHLVPYNVVPLFDHPIMWSSHYVIIPLCDHPIMWSSHYLIIPVFRLGGPMVGEQMRLDHGWWMGLWVMVQYGVHVIPLLFSPIQCRPVIWSSRYLIILVFWCPIHVVLLLCSPIPCHPVIWSSHRFVLLFTHPVIHLTHIIPLFDHPGILTSHTCRLVIM